MLLKFRGSIVPFFLISTSLIFILAGCTANENSGPGQSEVDTYRKISMLGEQQKALETKIQQHKDEIRKLTEENGAGYLDSRIEIQMQRVATFAQELVRIESGQLKLTVEIEVLEEISDKNSDQLKRLDQAKLELKTSQLYTSRMQEIMAKEEAEAVELGRRRLALEELKQQLQESLEEHEKIKLYIMELEARQVEKEKQWPW